MDDLVKQNIAKKIKSISLTDATEDFLRLQKIDLEQISSLSRTGLKFLDYFMYVERLNTVGSKGISFFTFLEDFELYRSRWPSINRLYSYATNIQLISINVRRKYFNYISLQLMLFVPSLL